MPRSFSHFRSVTLVIGLIALLFVAGACGGGDGDDSEPEATAEPIARSPQTQIIIDADEPIVVGISTALTGGATGVRGAEYRDAAITAIERWKAANGEQILGHDIEVHAEDDGCANAAITTRAAGRLLRGEDGHGPVPGLVGVLGPQCSGGVVAVMEDYAEAGIVMISGSATTTSLTEEQPEDGFFFRTAYRNDLEGTLIGLFVSTSAILGIESAYLIDNGGTYGEDLASSAAEVSEQNGLTVERRSIVEGTVDFSDLASEIAAASPDFVGFAGFNPEAALLYRQLRDAGYAGFFGAGDGAASQTGFVDPVGEAAEGVLFAGCTLPLPQDYLDDFVSQHGYEPSAAFPAQYADAATILLDAIASVAEAGPDEGSIVIDPIRLRDAVRATVLPAEEALSGGIAFDENGDRIAPNTGSLDEFVAQALANQDTNGYTDLGLIPCQVQGGRLVNLLGPDAGEILPLP